MDRCGDQARLALSCGALVDVPPGLGEVCRARIELDEVPVVGAVCLERCGDQFLGAPLPEEVVPPKSDGDAVDGFASERRSHALALRHRVHGVALPLNQVVRIMR